MTTRPRFTILSALLAILSASQFAPAQSVPPSKLSVQWEELTAADFREGIHRSQGTCLLPFGILEKHGPHLRSAPICWTSVMPRCTLRERIRDCLSRILFWPDCRSPSPARNHGLQPRDAARPAAGNLRRDGSQRLQEMIIVNGHGGNEACFRTSRKPNSINRTTTWSTFSTSALRTKAARPGKPPSTCTPAKAKPRR